MALDTPLVPKDTVVDFSKIMFLQDVFLRDGGYSDIHFVLVIINVQWMAHGYFMDAPWNFGSLMLCRSED